VSTHVHKAHSQALARAQKLPKHIEPPFKDDYGQAREIKELSEAGERDVIYRHRRTGRLFCGPHNNATLRYMRRSQPGEFEQVIAIRDNPSAHAGRS
jgi:hypothetical protein